MKQSGSMDAAARLRVSWHSWAEPHYTICMHLNSIAWQPFSSVSSKIPYDSIIYWSQSVQF